MRNSEFLVAILGDDGASALQKAAQRSVELENALVPRTILAWIGLATRSEYEGGLPGMANSYVAFKKSEAGFSGQISIDDSVYTFKDQTVYHLAASVAVSMGVDGAKVSPALKDQDLARLGKSIDLLVKARVCTEQLLRKDLPGQTAMPTPAAGPLEATPPEKQQGGPPRPQKQKPKPFKLPKVAASLPKLKLDIGQLQKRCRVCGESQLSKSGFTGCRCWAGMVQTATLAKNGDGTFTMAFGSDWDRDAFEAFVADMRIR